MRFKRLFLGTGDWGLGTGKSGFGILEVLVAAVVLGFMIIGLNVLQKGNRESVLRVRARDAASVVAQEVIDSISAIGPASVKAQTRACRSPTQEDNLDLCRTRSFDNKAGNVNVSYEVTVEVENATAAQKAVEDTDYLTALNTNTTNKPTVEHQFAKHVNIMVSWKFKNTNQSINMSTVIR